MGRGFTGSQCLCNCNCCITNHFRHSIRIFFRLFYPSSDDRYVRGFFKILVLFVNNHPSPQFQLLRVVFVTMHGLEFGGNTFYLIFDLLLLMVHHLPCVSSSLH